MNFKKVLSVAFVSALALTACNEEKKQKLLKHQQLNLPKKSK